MGYKVKLADARTLGLTRRMMQTGKMAMLNPKTKGIIVRHGDKFIELQKEVNPCEGYVNTYLDRFNSIGSFWDVPTGTVEIADGKLRCGDVVPTSGQHYISSIDDVTGDFSITVQFDNISINDSGGAVYKFYMQYGTEKIYLQWNLPHTPISTQQCMIFSTGQICQGTYGNVNQMRLVRVGTTLTGYYGYNGTYNWLADMTFASNGKITLGVEFTGEGEWGRVDFDNLIICWS